MLNARTNTIIGLVLAAAAMRLFPHPPNFAPIAAMALFAGAELDNRRLAFALPLVAMFLGDLVLGFHSGMPLVYACMAISVAIGVQLRGRARALPVTAGALAAAVLFFVVTNFGVWLTSGMYPLTAGGLAACYAAGIPFFHYTVIGNLVYAGVLFGGFALLRDRLPARDAVAV